VTEMRFVPAGPATSHDWDSSGLGLAVCSRCVTKATWGCVNRGLVPVCSPDESCVFAWHEITLLPENLDCGSCLFCDTVYQPTGDRS
jgi:hypothetical protein